MLVDMFGEQFKICTNILGIGDSKSFAQSDCDAIQMREVSGQAEWVSHTTLPPRIPVMISCDIRWYATPRERHKKVGLLDRRGLSLICRPTKAIRRCCVFEAEIVRPIKYGVASL